MNVLYIRDNSLTGTGIQCVLEQKLPGSVIHVKSPGEFNDPMIIRNYNIAVLDCLITDNSLEELFSCLAREKSVPVIALTKSKDIWPLLQKNIPTLRAMLNRDSDVDFFITAIRLVMAGGYCYSWNISALWSVTDNRFDESFFTTAGLTRREKEIFQLYLSGATNKTISDKLSRSEKTISAHKSNILRKLGLKNIPVTLDNCFKNSEGNIK